MNHRHARKRADVRRAFGLDTAYATVTPPRARKVVTRAPHRVVGYFSSAKTKAQWPWESQLEFDCLRLLEVDNAVEFYAVQPEVTEYEVDGRTRRYYPDIRVEYRDRRTEFIEVKFQATASLPKYQVLFEAVQAVYAARGYGFRVMTEKDIRQEPLLSNAKVVLKARDITPSSQLQMLVARTFNVHRCHTLGELEEVLGFGPSRRRELLAMANLGLFDLDLRAAPLSGNTRIVGVFDYSKVGG